MRLRTKIILLAVLPLVASLALIALAVRHQERDLARREHAMVQRAYMEARRTELRNYVELAASTLRPLYERGHDETAGRESLAGRPAAGGRPAQKGRPMRGPKPRAAFFRF